MRWDRLPRVCELSLLRILAVEAATAGMQARLVATEAAAAKAVAFEVRKPVLRLRLHQQPQSRLLSRLQLSTSPRC